MENDSTCTWDWTFTRSRSRSPTRIGPRDVELLGRTGPTKTDIDRLCTRLRSKTKDVRVVYESPYIRAVEALASVDDPKHARTEKQARLDD